MNKFKIKNGSFTNLIFVSLLLLVLFQKGPSWLANYKVEGKTVESFEALSESGVKVSFPVKGKRQVLVFWATWCGPCSIELSRLNAAVKDGDLKADDVVAVSIGEDPAVVWAAVKERDYKFRTVADPEVNSRFSFEVQGTPQTYHVDEQSRIQHASVGLGFFTVWRAQWFLN